MMILMILRQNPGAEEVLEVDFEAFPNVSKGFRCLAEVRKTVPSFFQILAAEPPKGLGVELPQVVVLGPFFCGCMVSLSAVFHPHLMSLINSLRHTAGTIEHVPA